LQRDNATDNTMHGDMTFLPRKSLPFVERVGRGGVAERQVKVNAHRGRLAGTVYIPPVVPIAVILPQPSRGRPTLPRPAAPGGTAGGCSRRDSRGAPPGIVQGGILDVFQREAVAGWGIVWALFHWR
jgi:hypothetical protein